MPSTATELLIILTLIFVNGILAMSEMSIVSSRKARLEQWSKEGNEGAKAALALASDPNMFIATIQIGITVIAILTGVFSGATVAEVLGQFLSAIPVLKTYSSAIGFGVVVVSISCLTLILGELAPKRIGLANAERIACIVAPPMWWLVKFASPVVRVLNATSDFCVRALGVKQSSEPPVTTEEIKLLLEHGTEAGVFQEAEEDMVKGVLRLAARKVTSLMTPRPRLIWLDIKDTNEKILSVLAKSPPQRLLVAEGDVDHLLGYVYTRHVLAQPVFANSVDLNACLKQPLFVPENKSALQVLEMFKRSGTHIAVILDEYGSIQGVVTMTDMLTAIVGEIDFPESHLAKGEKADEHCWVLDGLLPIDKFKELLAIEKLPAEESGHFHTLAGFIMHQIGYVPKNSDQFEWEGFRFHVTSMRGRSIEKVQITHIKADAESGAAEAAKLKLDK